MEDIETAVDRTSISVYDNTPGHSKESSEDRKYRSYEQVRKLHVMLNMNDKKAIAAKYSDGVYSDHYGACDLIEEAGFKHATKTLCADRAYDRHKLYKLCKEQDIKTKVLPKNGAAEHPKTDYMSDRNAAIRLMKLYGEVWCEGVEKESKLWKKGLYRRGFLKAEENIWIQLEE